MMFWKKTTILVVLIVSVAVKAEEQNVRAIVEANFKNADTDGNGTLDSAEFPALIDANAEHEIGRSTMVRRFGAYDRAFRTADSNGDGAIAWSEIMQNAPAP